MEVLPILQGLSTPMLLAVGYGVFRVQQAIHGLDVRLSVLESRTERNEHGV